MFTKTFRSGSNECFHGEAGGATLIETFEIGTGDSMPYWSKIAPYLEETCFLF